MTGLELIAYSFVLVCAPVCLVVWLAKRHLAKEDREYQAFLKSLEKRP